MRTVVTAVLVVASAIATAVAVTALPFYEDKSAPRMTEILVATGVLWALFALAIVALHRVPAKTVTVLVVAGSVAIGGAAMAGPPNTSTDSARYAWDGIVQADGISPYSYVPADAALADLRPDWLFPEPVIDAEGDVSCPGPRIMKVGEVGTDDVICTAINRGKVPTIYPPMAELYFAGIRLLVGPDAQYWPLQLTGLLISLGITLLLLRTLRARDLDPRWAALWGWSPLAATEGVTNSHVDILAALLLVVATVLVSHSRRWVGGIALGAAIAVKLVPAIGAPALLRRQGWKVAIAAIVTFAVLYVPYVITTGIGVLGYLPGYLTEEGYASGERFVLLAFLPGPAALVVAAVLIAITAVIVWRATDPSSPWLGQVIMIGATLLIVTPRYPWYALLLVPMIAMTGRWEWLAVPLALTERLLVPSADLARLSATIAIVFIVVVSLRRAGPHAVRRMFSRDVLRRPTASSSPADS